MEPSHRKGASLRFERGTSRMGVGGKRCSKHCSRTGFETPFVVFFLSSFLFSLCWLHLIMKNTIKSKQDLQDNVFKVERYLKSEALALSLQPEFGNKRK